MYNLNILTSTTDSTYSLFGLVGLRQSSDPDYPTYGNSLLESRSNRYLQDIHGLLTSEIIDQCGLNYDLYSYTAYSDSTTYQLGSKVSYSGTNYEYINPTPSSGNLPTDTIYWKVIDNISDYLIRRQIQAITSVLDDCFDAKKTKQIVKTIMKETSLFTGRGNVNRKEINRGKFVGLKIKLAESRSLVIFLNKIGTQLSGAVDFNIYVYHSSRVAPIAIIPISQTTANDFQWTSGNNLDLRFLKDETSSWNDAGGSFWIGYYQNDLGVAQALRKDYDWAREPCAGCNGLVDYDLYREWSKFFSVEPFEIESGHLNGINLPDLDYAGYNYASNYGLNLNFSTECDLSYFIKQHEKVLSRAIALKWALLHLNDIAYSIRDNKISERTKQLALMEMDTNKMDSIGNQYAQAIKAMSFDFSTLDNVCLPCDNKYGITWSGM